MTGFYKKCNTGLIWVKNFVNPFQANVSFLYPLKKSEKQRFSDVFRGGGIEREHWPEMGQRSLV